MALVVEDATWFRMVNRNYNSRIQECRSKSHSLRKKIYIYSNYLDLSNAN